MCCLSQHELTCESESRRLLFGCTGSPADRWDKLVPFSVTSSLMVVNICSMSLPPWQSLDAGWCHWACECQMWIFNQQAVKHRLSPQFYCEPSENTWHLFNFIWWNIFCDLSASAMLTHEFNILSHKSSLNLTEMNLKSLVRRLILAFRWICSSVIPINRLLIYYQPCPYHLNTVYPCNLLLAVARIVFSYGEVSVDFNLNPIS